MLSYKILGRSGLWVSEFCLGTVEFGGDSVDKKTSHDVLSRFKDAGGNFIDSANKYNSGETEEIVGSWLKGIRDQIVMTTKYSMSMDGTDPNASGNHRKHMMSAVESSLRRLQTDYIDLLWVHAYDSKTPIDEVLRGLDDLIRQGKVNYIGVSNFPSWLVSASNVLAELRGWTSFIALQIEYNLICRDAERELIPMANQFGLSIVPWGPMAGGVLSGKYTRDVTNDNSRIAYNTKLNRTTERGLGIARAVDEIADEIGATSPQVAIAWILSRGYGFVPTLGARRVDQLEDTMAANTITLPSAAIDRLDQVSSIDLGYPHTFLTRDNVAAQLHGDKVEEKLVWGSSSFSRL